MKRYLTAAQVAELAELLEDSPRRVGVIDELLGAASRGRGMTLRLQSSSSVPGEDDERAGHPGAGEADG